MGECLTVFSLYMDRRIRRNESKVSRIQRVKESTGF